MLERQFYLVLNPKLVSLALEKTWQRTLLQRIFQPKANKKWKSANAVFKVKK